MLQEQKLHVIHLQKSLSKIIKEKLTLISATNVFNENLSHILENKNIMMDKVNVEEVFRNQAEADEDLRNLAFDYELLIEDAWMALEIRKKRLQRRNKVLKEFSQGKIGSDAKDDAEREFVELSQRMRRELEHFDMVMKAEFREGTVDHNFKYVKVMNGCQESSH